MPIAALFVPIVLLPTVAAWKRWLGAERQSLQGGRKALFVLGLSAVSLALFEYCLFALYTNHIGGFGTDFPAMLKWARPGFWISLAALLLSVSGTGKSRAWGMTASALALVLWIIPVWGM